ncbi:hypothetical protein BT96DRAFT_998753 [Gymnopus androsaceus JB14]|uniref:Uncharacterized protein n=1 Tax=Gymnopus androsaceus JB14 TaxID=1447944 RepID=A0A6A4H912_9AGAR|nr:hypothetical protein BT96DRAFT_998753 [Gymnopus androsaceus JB14]
MPQTVRTHVDWGDGLTTSIFDNETQLIQVLLGSFMDVEITRSFTCNTITTRTFTSSPYTQGNTPSTTTNTEHISPAVPQTPRLSASISASPQTPRTPNPPPPPVSPRTPRTPNPPPPPASPRTPRTPNALTSSPTPYRGSRQVPAHTPSRSSRQDPALPQSPSLTSTSSVTDSLIGETTHAVIPHPQDLVQPQRVNGSKFYVVFAGTRVGIFGNWYALSLINRSLRFTIYLGH